MTVETWKLISQAKQAARDSLIPQEWRLSSKFLNDETLNVLNIPRTCGILSPPEIAITETPADELVRQMSKGQLSSYDVTLAFCKRSAIAQQLVSRIPRLGTDGRQTA